VATVTVRPNGAGAAGTGLTIGGGAASHQVAQSDNSDTTWSEWAATANPALVLEFGSLVLPAYAQVRRVTPRVRLALAAVGTRQFSYRPQIEGLAWFGPLSSASPGTALSTYTGSAATSGPAGDFRQSDLDALQLMIQPQSTGAVPIGRSYEAYLDVEYNEAPVAGGITPSGNVGTAQPTVGFTYTDPEGDIKERHRVKIFTQAQINAVGFDPNTTAPVYDSGEVLSNGTTQAVTGAFLADNVVHRAYVRVGDLTPTGFAAKYGPWTQGPQFTPINTTAATPPAPVATPILPTARVSLSVSWTVGDLTNPRIDVQRSTDGLTWWWVRGGQQWAPGAGSPQTIDDYEAPRDIPVRYRVRLTGLRAGLPAASAWSPSSTPVTLAADGYTWLKSPTDPGFNIAVHHAETEFESTAEEDVAEFWPEGRRTPLVVGGTIRAEEFKALDFFFKTDAAWRAFEALRLRQEPLLLQTCFGDAGLEQYWVRLGKTRSVTRLTWDGMATEQYRRVSIAAWEVSPPTETIYGVPGEVPFILDESVLS